ncbi:type II toxin-antitoxin system YoeB family toxin [Paractinoplanes atraurantiacus]|uniref:Antitoxin n=1 Tax=Paractinoplanes atraurantiacus TaxID=1036182 RepID=A0A285GYY8_9ACTN|nr:type II toxin-antitoxin system YoeB family toxin [Actinoplanes atraurantiacus]SNY28840.1 Toxin component of the Txe-Axe toxin-antitoxin module, Txe/YoeB family [Actinoplanes atraurantiacus]
MRKNFAAVVDSVIDDAEECVIPRGGGKAVVIVSLDEWNAMNETLRIVFTPHAWLRHDTRMARRISKLIIDVQRDPHGTGLGKPELLKGPLAGWSSRRIEGRPGSAPEQDMTRLRGSRFARLFNR